MAQLPFIPNDKLGKQDVSKDFVVCIQLTQQFEEKLGWRCEFQSKHTVTENA